MTQFTIIIILNKNLSISYIHNSFTPSQGKTWEVYDLFYDLYTLPTLYNKWESSDASISIFNPQLD